MLLLSIVKPCAAVIEKRRTISDQESVRTKVVRDQALHPKPVAVEPLLWLLQPQRRLRSRLDLCAQEYTECGALRCIKRPERDCRMQQHGSPERNNLNITVCDVAYDEQPATS